MQFFVTFIIAYISGIVVSLFFIDSYRLWRSGIDKHMVTRILSYENITTVIKNIADGHSTSFDIHPQGSGDKITTRVIITNIPPLKTSDSTEEATK